MIKRRHFLRTSAWGLLAGGYALDAVAQAAAYPYTSGINPIFNEIAAREYSLFDVEPALEQSGRQAAQNWLRTGYCSQPGPTFWAAGDEYALMPLQLLTPGVGLLDEAVLVFARNTHKEWVHAGTLSGFHLEAVGRLLQKAPFAALDADEKRRLILPVLQRGHYSPEGWAFSTAVGAFRLQVNVRDGRSSITASLKKDHVVLWQDSYVSQLGLRNTTRQPA